MEISPFLYLACQRRSVRALKDEMARRFPDWRFSYSHGGFLTYKRPENAPNTPKSSDAAFSKLVFARTVAFSLGKLENPTPARFWETVRPILDGLVKNGKITQDRKLTLHVWEPETELPDGEPAVSMESKRAAESLRAAVPADFAPYLSSDDVAAFDAVCLDIVRVGEESWWLGRHTANDFHSRYAGGILPLALPTDAASRAWLKFEEGLRWSEFPIGVESRCADIGASPGGGSQALLARGAIVLGVDPAEMDARVLKNPNFTHLRGKISQLKRSAFRKTRWLIADMNVAPNYTLDALEELSLRPQTEIRGLLFTLKLFDFEQAAGIPDYIRRIKSWGFNRVKVRQLTFNHQEVMVAALKKPFRP